MQLASILSAALRRPLRPICNSSTRALHTFRPAQEASPSKAEATAAPADPSYTASADDNEDRKWIMDMPSRAIAHELLQLERPIMEHDKLYAAVEPSGLLRSRRHFKHCLKMMKRQRRLDVVCLGPEFVGSDTRKFAVTLTKNGVQIFTWYRSVGGYAGGAHWRKAFEEHRAKQEAAAEQESKGLAEALP